jgi:hypothetical protein
MDCGGSIPDHGGTTAGKLADKKCACQVVLRTGIVATKCDRQIVGLCVSIDEEDVNGPRHLRAGDCSA